jgi:hypothetical protein
MTGSLPVSGIPFSVISDGLERGLQTPQSHSDSKPDSEPSALYPVLATATVLRIGGDALIPRAAVAPAMGSLREPTFTKDPTRRRGWPWGCWAGPWKMRHSERPPGLGVCRQAATGGAAAVGMGLQIGCAQVPIPTQHLAASATAQIRALES